MLNEFVLALLASSSTVALAQDPPSTDTENVSATASAPEDQGTTGGNEEIVVTATRREQSLQDVPIAVTALTADTLQSSGVEAASTLTQLTPGLVFSRTQILFQPVLRGVGSNNTGPGVESPIAVYIDGVYQPDLNANQIDLLQVERVEVLRGPQGTLFGRNATGGLINIITADPTFRTQFEARARYGSFNERSLRAYASTGINDVAAIDFAAQLYADDGFVEDLVRGGTTGERESFAARSRLLIETDAAELRITANYFNTDDSSIAVGQPLNGNTAARAINPNIVLPTRPNQYAGVIPATAGSEGGGLSVEFGTDLGGVKLETTTSYSHSTAFLERDSGVAPIPVLFARADVDSDSWTQEIRFISDNSGPLRWIAGVYGFLSNAGYVPLQAGPTRLEPRTQTYSLAAFGEATYELTEALHVTAGLRYTFEDRDFTQRINGNRLFSTGATFDNVSPRLLVQYFFNEDVNAYVSYSTAFKSGGFNAGGTSPLPVAPEINSAFEGGIKADPFSWLRVNLAAFAYDYTDLQISIQPPGLITPVQTNAGGARMRGAELEVTARPVPGLQFRGAFSVLDATYSDLQDVVVQVPRIVGGVAVGGNVGQVIDASGNRVLRAPPYTASLGVNYEHEFSGGYRAGFSTNLYLSGEVTYTFDERITQDDYMLLGGEIFFQLPDDRWRVSIWGDNITDEEVLETVTSSTFGDIVAYRRPARFGVAVAVSF